jgi:hypothetical protein
LSAWHAADPGATRQSTPGRPLAALHSGKAAKLPSLRRPPSRDGGGSSCFVTRSCDDSAQGQISGKLQASPKRLGPYRGTRGYLEAAQEARSQPGAPPARPRSKLGPPAQIQPPQEQLAHIRALPTSQHLSTQSSLDANIGSSKFVGSVAHSSHAQAAAASMPVARRTALNEPGPAFAEYCKWQAENFERQRAKWLREHPVEVPVLRSDSLRALLEPEVNTKGRQLLGRANTFASRRVRDGAGDPSLHCCPQLP